MREPEATRRAAVATIVGGALVTGALLTGAPAAAQDEESLPTATAGTPVVVLPLQSAWTTPGGAWPGGARNQAGTIEALQAELAFAFGELEGTEDFVLPHEVVDRARRNPLAKVEPRRLAYEGLIGEPEPTAQIYEPLHSQLRRLGALFDARLVVLPLRLWYEPAPPAAAGAGSGEGETAAASGAEPASGGAGAEGGAASDPETAGAARGRAVLLFAVIDVRRSAVLWHGTMRGGLAEADSPSLLTSLAFRVARQLAP